MRTGDADILIAILSEWEKEAKKEKYADVGMAPVIRKIADMVDRLAEYENERLP